MVLTDSTMGCCLGDSSCSIPDSHRINRRSPCSATHPANPTALPRKNLTTPSQHTSRLTLTRGQFQQRYRLTRKVNGWLILMVAMPKQR
jgi:hypothetical protein